MIEVLLSYWQPFLYSDGQQISGLAMTLWLTTASIGMGFVLSIPLAIARVSENRWVRWPVHGFTYLFRGTPLYIQLLICYSGIYSLAAVQSQPLLGAFFRDAINCTLLAFTLNTAAYQAEILRGSILSVAQGQREACKALNLSRWTTFRKIVLPQSLLVAIGPLGNELILMIKASAIASLVTIYDLMGVTKMVFSRSFDFQVYLWAAVLYLVIVEVVRRSLKLIEGRLGRHLQ